MKAILHIGQQKTGSTILQNFFSEHQEILLKEYGILYPRSLGIKKQRKLLQSSEELLNANSDLSKEFQKELSSSNPRIVFFSEENLFAVNQNKKHNIYTFLNKIFNEVEILVYLRRQEDHILSLYQQKIRGKYTLTIPEFVKDKLQSNNSYYNYYTNVNNWENIFGQNKVRVKCFHNLRESDICRDVLYYLGLNWNFPDFQRNGRSTNKSFDAVSTELIRTLNILESKNPKLFPIKFKRFLRLYLKDKTRQQKFVLSQQLLDFVYRTTQTSNELLCKSYFHKENDKKYFLSPYRSEQDAYLNENISKSKLVNLMYEIYLSYTNK